MKIAISIPDPLFEAAEKFAKHKGLSQDSVVNVSQIITVDKSFVIEQVRQIEDRIILHVDESLR
ncbi:type II toxin-antitoxin system PemK/MazF family toxin [Anabaena cylindrica UHCC 0172]|uniref:type II toxin-antitoxin system PemK/MazF family toxin n=1 Tax=Anabaena cylindrica TaxID=1165 RepID=UPI002B20725F|nr:type II toxin-antitoxin system PemK/MazF family toxin [Anabaena cylindrica]MEA5552098.1 type II toxin-antitoxin system PemK/MazF family toxin [Anabaena cylindrica UHCC 0172]